GELPQGEPFGKRHLVRHHRTRDQERDDLVWRGPGGNQEAAGAELALRSQQAADELEGTRRVDHPILLELMPDLAQRRALRYLDRMRFARHRAEEPEQAADGERGRERRAEKARAGAAAVVRP